MNTATSLTTDTPATVRRTAGLVGNPLVLAGAVLFLCEFVGIIGSHVHTMPAAPDASASALATTYAGQVGATAFLVGWYAVVLPGRVLFALGLRRALLDSDRSGRVPRSLLDWAVGLMVLGVATEVASGAVLAATAAAAAHGSTSTVPALNAIAYYLQVALQGPGGVALVVFAVAMWRSGVFPRVLTGVALVAGAVNAVSGTLLSAPSTAALQQDLTSVNLLLFVATLWIGILVFLRRPRSGSGSGVSGSAEA